MNLKEIIETLEFLPKDIKLPVGFHNPHCYRGYYHILSFSKSYECEVGYLLNVAKSTVGETYIGWTGGATTMTLESDVVFAEEGALCHFNVMPGLRPEGIMLRKERLLLESELYFFKLLNEKPSSVVSDSSYIELLKSNILNVKISITLEVEKALNAISVYERQKPTDATSVKNIN